jgi:hypothetical protein
VQFIDAFSLLAGALIQLPGQQLDDSPRSFNMFSVVFSHAYHEGPGVDLLSGVVLGWPWVRVQRLFAALEHVSYFATKVGTDMAPAFPGSAHLGSFSAVARSGRRHLTRFFGFHVAVLRLGLATLLHSAFAAGASWGLAASRGGSGTRPQRRAFLRCRSSPISCAS